MSKRKPIIAVDFDGVLNSYTKGWQGPSVIEEPVEGAMDFLREAVEHFDVVICSSRLKTDEGREAVTWWTYSMLLEAFGLPIGAEIMRGIRFELEKPPAIISIDDRAFQFRGVFPSVEDIQSFKPWYKE